MQEKELREILKAHQQGSYSTDEVIEKLKTLPFESLDGMVTIDHHRQLRTGIPEVIFGQGKTADQLTTIFTRMIEKNQMALATRMEEHVYLQIRDRLPAGVRFHPTARVLYFDQNPQRDKRPGVVVVTAGTTDIPAAEEAAITAEILGNEVKRIFDVGVAGIHRLLEHLPTLRSATVIIVAAGMEGALPSVVGGLVSAPVIALPTSVGYGASFQGLSALLGMLNSCANGVAVVNIDNGFGAGCLAAKINQLAHSNNENEQRKPD